MFVLFNSEVTRNKSEVLTTTIFSLRKVKTLKKVKIIPSCDLPFEEKNMNLDTNELKPELNLLQVAQMQRTQRKQLETKLEELTRRREVAMRRLAAYEAEKSGKGTNVWLGMPSEVKTMKDRLKAASTNESVLMGIVDELRDRREKLTNEAFIHYAQQQNK